MSPTHLLHTVARWTTVITLLTSALVVTFLEGRNATDVSASTGTISGVVFNDYDVNGTQRLTADTAESLRAEPGVSGVIVRAFDSDGILIGSTTTASNGSYSIDASSAATNNVRIEFVVPEGFQPSFAASGGSTVQFVNRGATSVNLGVHVPGDFCQANPLVTCTLVEDTVGTFGSLRGFNWDNSGSEVPIATNTETGAIWGLAWHKQTRKLISAPTVRRMTKVYESPAGTPRLGQLFVSGTASGTTQPYVDVAELGVDVGTIPSWSTRSTAVNGVYDGFAPNGTWDLTGKVGIGDIDVSPDGEKLWFINLYDRELYGLNIGGSPLTPAADLTSSDVTSYALPQTNCVNGVLRPWAIGVHSDATVFVGAVCSAENGGAAANLEAVVYRFDPVTKAFGSTPVLRFALNYTKGNAHVAGLNNENNKWFPWWETPNQSGNWYTGRGAMPILSDIVLSSDGSMSLGFLDRMAQRAQTWNVKGSGLPGRSSITDWFWTAGGDILRACTANQQTWQIEPLKPTLTSRNCTINGTTYFTGKAHSGQQSYEQEFYNDTVLDYYRTDYGGGLVFEGGHAEGALGGLATYPGASHIVGTIYDPNTELFTGGARWFSLADGSKRALPNASTGDRELVSESTTPRESFGKAGGLGDVEVLCDMAPLQIGNRIWADVDGDGIQDPGEAGISGVTVRLYDAGGTEVATTTTDANGEYRFSSTTDNLQPYTAYTIRLDNPVDYADGGALAEYYSTKANQSSSETSDADDLIDSDAVLAGGSSYGVDRFPRLSVPALEPGYNNHSYDFGFSDPQVSVGDRVWHDLDRDGVQDDGEVGIANVTVRLTYADGSTVFDLDGNEVTTSITDSTGNYIFENLPPGQYKVTTDPPSGFTASTATQDTSMVLALGEEDLSLDFGFYTPKVSVGNLVWFDVDRDGVQDAGEPGIAGATVTITKANGDSVVDVLGNPVTTTTTDVNGNYSFPNLPLGQYTVTVTDPSGYTATLPGVGGSTTDSSSGFATSTNLTSDGASDTSLDFGFYAPVVSVGDHVWFDIDRDGVQDVGEPGVANVTVSITTAAGGPVTDVFGNAVTSTTTDENGNYIFENLPVGSYKVTMTTPTGYTASTATNDTSTNLLVDGASDMSLDFGIYAPMVSVGDVVWRDSNANGVQDSGELGIAGVTLTLTKADGTVARDVFGNLVTTTVTDANGNYSFTQLPPGSYKVTVADPSGLVPTKTGQGTTLTDSSTGYATSANLATDGASDMSLDFGFRVPSVSVGNLVWLDTNADGIQGLGEPGIAGVTLTIKKSNGDPVTDVFGQAVTTTTTDANGNYSFPHLPLGQYTVTVTDPQGLIATTTGEGNSSIDSSTGFATSINLTVDGAVDTTLDFGFRMPAVSVGDRVWFDGDGDGIQDEGENGIEGVSVTLKKADGTDAYDLANNKVTPITTDANGNYVFGNLPDGSYKVIVTAPNGYSATTALEFTSAALAGDGASDMSLDFGFKAPMVSVGDRVWFDSDGDGTQNDGELGIAGVTLSITTVNGDPVRDVFGNTVASVTTDVNGNYRFTNLPLGQYTVTVVDPIGYTPTKDGEGSTDNDSSTGSATCVVLTTDGASDLTLDFGYTAPVVWIGGNVWSDNNGDGIGDSGENGMPRMTLFITKADGSPVRDVFGNLLTTTTTDAAGNYRFDNLPVGEYMVSVTDPYGYTATTVTTRTSGVLSTDAANNPSLNFGFRLVQSPSSDLVQQQSPEQDDAPVNNATKKKSGKPKASPSSTVTSQGLPVEFVPTSLGKPSKGARFVSSRTMISPTSTSVWSTNVSTKDGVWSVVGGAVRFTPKMGFEGTVTIRYRLIDSFGKSAVSTLTVTVGDPDSQLPSTGTNSTHALMLWALTFIFFGFALSSSRRRAVVK